jgi:predicted GTPase
MATATLEEISLAKTITGGKKEHNIRKITVGKPNLMVPGPGKVLMLLGATGAGKSTLVDGLVNNIMGVRYDDDYRYKLIDDEEKASQAHSQTKWITAYTFHQQDDLKLPYTFTVIDTPGYGDTEGLERDKQITKQIKEFFSIKGPQGIDHLDGIGLVVPNALPRFTNTQKYIFDCMLGIFGNDVVNNIFMMVTFADGSPPPVLAAIEKADIQYQKYFTFNNQLNGENESPILKKAFWEMGAKSFDDFFSSFHQVEKISLTVTNDVLCEREKLVSLVDNIQKNILLGLEKIDQLQEVKRAVSKNHEKDLTEGKTFIYTSKECALRKVKLPRGYFVTNCSRCNTTCHFPCKIPEDKDKANCLAMKINGYCKFCPSAGKCHWRDHHNSQHRFVSCFVEEKGKSSDLNKRYGVTAKNKSQAPAIIINGLGKEIVETSEVIFFWISEAKDTINYLKTIALIPNPLSSEIDYIDIMIEGEKRNVKSGFQRRISAYEEVRKRAVVLNAITDAKEKEEYLRKLKVSSISWLRNCFQKIITT